jgi:nitroimidazol reductase NimA-like FMN-containing flavoprotein (pyridoxamine 5'-phosphate oxidase superfamily)
MAEGWRGKIGGMEPERRDFYLEGPALARISAINADGFPHVVPAWYHWDGTAFWFVLRERAEIAALLVENPKCGLVIDEGSVKDEANGRFFEMPKVWAQGIAEVIEEPNIGGRWVDIASKMAVRYLGPNGPEYIQASINQPRWLFRVEPTVLKTWEGTGWAKRYWVENDKTLSYDEAHGLRKSTG